MYICIYIYIIYIYKNVQLYTFIGWCLVVSTSLISFGLGMTSTSKHIVAHSLHRMHMAQQRQRMQQLLGVEFFIWFHLPVVKESLITPKSLPLSEFEPFGVILHDFPITTQSVLCGQGSNSGRPACSNPVTHHLHSFLSLKRAQKCRSGLAEKSHGNFMEFRNFLVDKWQFFPMENSDLKSPKK